MLWRSRSFREFVNILEIYFAQTFVLSRDCIECKHYYDSTEGLHSFAIMILLSTVKRASACLAISTFMTTAGLSQRSIYPFSLGSSYIYWLISLMCSQQVQLFHKYSLIFFECFSIFLTPKTEILCQLLIFILCPERQTFWMSIMGRKKEANSKIFLSIL